MDPLKPSCHLPIILALALSSHVLAGDAASKTPVQTTPAIWEKPAWLTDLSLGVRESYDSNVYAAGADSRFYPATWPKNLDVALKNRPSWVTTISPKVGVDLAKLWNDTGWIKTFAIGYMPDIVQYHNQPNESYTAHRVTTVLKTDNGAVKVNIDNAFTAIDGSHDGLIYPGGYSSFCNSTTRERRDQVQDRMKATVKFDSDTVFVRPALSLQYYNLDTTFMNVSKTYNYMNYVDRYDINGGADVGYYLDKKNALTLGYRYGHQYQQSLPWDAQNSTNDYQRILAGYEGSPVKWLKIEAQVGPQFTTYTDLRPYNNGVKAQGLIDTNPTDVYAEASVTITPTKSDALVLKYKRWNWVSSTGKNAYMDSQIDSSYRHQFTKKLQLQLGFRVSQSDYKPTTLRNDWLYTTSAGFKYAFTQNLTGEISYVWDQDANDQVYGITNPTSRNFERQVVSTGVTWAF
ncbi:MAG: outer membrane beta-barrel protein [Chthoniobacteraceae bacterium]